MWREVVHGIPFAFSFSCENMNRPSIQLWLKKEISVDSCWFIFGVCFFYSVCVHTCIYFPSTKHENYVHLSLEKYFTSNKSSWLFASCRVHVLIEGSKFHLSILTKTWIMSEQETACSRNKVAREESNWIALKLTEKLITQSTWKM